jgi:hypothetical protein
VFIFTFNSEKITFYTFGLKSTHWTDDRPIERPIQTLSDLTQFENSNFRQEIFEN